MSDGFRWCASFEDVVDIAHMLDANSDRNDPIAFEAAYPVVYAYLFRRCGQADVSEELAAATFVSAVSSDNAERWPLAWLYAIARNKLIDHWRRAGRAHAGEQRRQQEGRVDDGGHEAVDVRLDVAEVLGQLNPDHQAVLALRHVDDLTVAQCAVALERTQAATESLLRRAELAFRTAWTDGPKREET